MKIAKIVLGFLILYGAGSEYASASRQLLTFFSPGLILAVISMIFLSAWLIGSGFSKENLRLKSIKFLKYFIISAICFVLVAFVSLASYRPSTEIIEANGISVPIGECMDGSRRMVPDIEQRRAYCTCVVEKLANSEEIMNEYTAELESGKLNQIIEAIKEKEISTLLEINACFNSVELQ